MKTEKKLEILDATTAEYLYKVGYLRKGMDYPRFQSIIFGAEYSLSLYHHVRTYTRNKQDVFRAILLQPFSGVRGEWVEQNKGKLGNGKGCY